VHDFHQDFQTQTSRSARCATRNERPTDEWSLFKEQLRWARVIEKERGFANIPLNDENGDE